MTVKPDFGDDDWRTHVADPARSAQKVESERARGDLERWLRRVAADRTPDGVAGPARWFLIRVHAGRTASIAIALNRQGIRCWCPRLKFHKRLPRRQEHVLEKEIAFPGYLFVLIVPSPHGWHGVQTIDGVAGFVGDGRGPVPLTTRQFKELRREFRHPVKISRRAPTLYRIGEKVRVIVGSFAGFQGAVARPDDVRNRIRVEVDIFGRQTVVDMTVDQIRPIG